MGKKKEKISSAEKRQLQLLKKIKRLLLPGAILIVLSGLIFLCYELFLNNKYYPRTLVGDTNISFLTTGQASQILAAKLEDRLKQTVTFEYQSESSNAAKIFSINLASMSAKIDYSSLDFTFNDQHNNSLLDRFSQQFTTLFRKKVIQPDITLTPDEQLTEIAKTISQAPQDAVLAFNDTTTPQGSPSADIQIKPSVNGVELDQDKLILQLKNYLIFGNFNTQIPTKNIPPKIDTSRLEIAKKTLQDLLIQPIKLHFQDKTWTLDAKQLLTILNMTDDQGLLDEKQTRLYIKKIAADVDQKVQEGQFQFDETSKRVAVFSPSQDGRQLDQDQTVSLINNALQNQTKDLDLPVSVVKSKVQTQDVNNLGIKELLGRGISNFNHSIPNRIYNVQLTAKKINGVLVPPGEVFSFDQTVGDISASTGYKQAYVIKEGRTVLDDGGGVCQDSTTVFRAVLNAGLPVVKRTAHAYRVEYYEQGFPPGMDATIYYPSVDFQFKNDTAHYILLEAYTVGYTLYVDLYGTSDGRTVNITTPVVTNVTPAPPELRQDDPTLPRGTIKQVDFAAKGADVSFKRTVSRDGQVIANETWKSHYQPWQAIYLVGTGG